MCGIHLSVCQAHPVYPDDTVVQLLKDRGPDSFRQEKTIVQDANNGQIHLTFSSSVLSLRGNHTAVQPLVDRDTGSIFCWNGEAWKIDETPVSGNDGELIFDLLLRVKSTVTKGQLSQEEVDLRIRHVIDTFNSVRGPFAFVFYDALIGKVFFGRDCLGRRSLLFRHDLEGSFFLSSVCPGAQEHGFEEVEADGIYMLDMARSIAEPRTVAGLAEFKITLGQAMISRIWHIPYCSKPLADPDITALVSR